MKSSAFVAAVAVVLSSAAGAYAQSAPPSEPSAAPAVPPPPPPVDAYTGPNRAMIGTGVMTIALWYVPGVFIASASNVSSDGNLAIPLAGPWADLAGRPQCGAGSISCRAERWNQTLLVADGLFQAWGLAAIVTGLFIHERPRATADVRVAPAQVGASGYGVMAVGTF